MEKITCRIKENSWLAKIAAAKLHSKQVALVLGGTIHLYGASRSDLLSNISWLRHEVCHVRQYRQYGRWLFLWLYFVEWCRKGYYNNHFEIAARAAENDPYILEGIHIT
ncbi:DUF4157 domain-containing protein [Chitinophaga pendula]|uniref:DUF4157 domain-containing protein n=1 Tax=Chitinophaga TaxID=79328 RepID=UPI000BAE78CD|nr:MULTISPECIES: DUF4157 domain-containing protein [Chitinophaga]ASZ09932.1 DUF4157 domain-containing protein [Chitinophaga sp. MD30]UCJ07128.1 DUF4157 domain-containing protein [Chitinophaga pendula]